MSATVIRDLFFSGPDEEQDSPEEPRSGNVTGRVGEFLACAALAEMGLMVHHVPSTGYDLIADDGGKLIRVQVKAVTKPAGRRFAICCQVEHGTKTLGQNIRQRIRVPLTAVYCDVIAVVSIGDRRVVFLPVSDLSDAGGSCVSVADYRHPDAERISWLRSTQAAEA